MPPADPHAALSYAEALERVIQHCRPLAVESVPFDAMAGRVLAEEVCAASPEPPRAKSGMDGFALRAEETAGATETAPVTFPYERVVGAGHVNDDPVPRGEAVRIMTGAPLPPGVDAVVKREDTEPAEDGRFTLRSPLRPGENVIAAGAILREGQRLLPAGSVVSEQALGLLAGQGRAAWNARRRPRVGLLALGDELVAPGQPLGPGQLYVSNLYGLEALCRRYGAEPLRLGIAGDDPAAIEALLRDALKATAEHGPCDVLLTLGGSHHGDFDFADTVLERIGARLQFRSTRINIGGSTLFSTLSHEGNDVVCFGLPGTPMASWLAFEVLVRPALWRLAGRASVTRPLLRAALTDELAARPGRTHFIPARVEVTATDGPRVTALARGTPLALPASVLANGLIHWPEDVPRLPQGSEVAVELLELPADGGE